MLPEWQLKVLFLARKNNGAGNSLLLHDIYLIHIDKLFLCSKITSITICKGIENVQMYFEVWHWAMEANPKEYEIKL